MKKQKVKEREKLILNTIDSKDISEIKEFLGSYSGNYVSSTYSCKMVEV